MSRERGVLLRQGTDNSCAWVTMTLVQHWFLRRLCWVKVFQVRVGLGHCFFPVVFSPEKVQEILGDADFQEARGHAPGGLCFALL